ncbi:MAG: hypothetical protein CM1200mP20_15940 [Pseudomonadota bacterium]|nr:MAG: hypothetical protein CM1200mP20_15940 [Pseudomonadota bacterium]
MAGLRRVNDGIEPAVELFLRQTLVAVISTVDQKGAPAFGPIWYHWEDGAPICSPPGSLKWRNIQPIPMLLCVLTGGNRLISQLSWRGQFRKPTSALRTGARDGSEIFGKRGKGTEFAEGYKDRSQDVAAFHLVPDRFPNYLKE